MIGGTSWASRLSIIRSVLGVVKQPVQQGRGEDGVVVEDTAPLLVDTVCNQRGAVFIAVADDVEQVVGAELVDRKVAKFVKGAFAAMPSVKLPYPRQPESQSQRFMLIIKLKSLKSIIQFWLLRIKMAFMRTCTRNVHNFG